MFKNLFLIGLAYCFYKPLLAQSLPDTTKGQSSALAAIDFYYQDLDQNLGVYQGREYVDYDLNIKGHPYFQTEEFQNGEVVFDGTRYLNIPIKYDLAKEKLIVLHPNKAIKIELKSEKVQSFILLNKKFIYIKSTDSSHIQTGFYHLLYEGALKVLAKRRKNIDERMTAQENNRWFYDKITYYVEKEGVFYKVKNKNSLLKLFKDKKKEVVKLIRKNRINFSDNPEVAIVKISQFYDKIQ